MMKWRTPVVSKLANKTKHLRIDGLANIFHTQYALGSFIWLIVFITSAFFNTYLIVKSFNQYNQHRVTTTVRYLTEKQSVLPTITICNINPFTSSFAQNLLRKANLKTKNGGEQVDYWRMYLKLEAYMNRTRGYLLTTKEKLALADPTVMLFILEYLMQTFAYYSYRFTRIFHPKYFTCFVFNIYGNESLSRSQDGIFSLLYTGAADEDSWNVMFPANIRGVYMFIQNATDYLYGTDRSPILITTSHATKLTISRHFYKQQPWPYSECAVLEDNSLADTYTLRDTSVFDAVRAVTNSTYTRKTCLSFCTQLMIVRQCGCKSNRIAYTVSADIDYCSIDGELVCATSVWLAINEINAECVPKCPLECSHMAFEVMQNINVWKDVEFFRIRFPYFVDHLTLVANAILLEIMYNDLAYVETLEEPKMSGEDLLAAIGGHLHLFLGMSLLSFIELIELISAFLIGRVVLKENILGPMSKKKKKNNKKREIGLKMAGYLNMVAIPNVVRSSHMAVSIVWIALFVCSGTACVYFIVNTVHQYNMNLVTTTLKHSADHTSDIRFCQTFWTTSQLAVSMLSKLDLLSTEQWESVNAINAYVKNTSGSYLNSSEMSLYGDLNRAVVHCDINGKPCDFEFYSGCYRVLPRNLGNHRKINIICIYVTCFQIDKCLDFLELVS